MPTTRLESLAALASHLGQEVAVSDWLDVGPGRVQRFADATDDHQWIHLDETRAAAESPYGTTIAHGLLTLSLIVPLVQQAVAIDGVRLTVNYGFDKVRFPAAVPVGARVRARVAVAASELVKDGSTQVTWRVTIEREGGDKPAVVADWIARLHA